MRRLLLLPLVACSGSPSKPQTKPSPPPAIAQEATASAPNVQAEVCGMLFPPYEPTAEDLAAGVADGGYLTEGGHTLDEKNAEVASKAPLGGVCDVRRRDATEVALLKLAAPAKRQGSPVAWDRKTTPAHRDVVRGALALTSDEEARLARDGFVVPERLAYGDYTTAYYDVHRSQMPVFVTADSIFHAVYASHDQLLADLERNQLFTRLDRLLAAMHCQLKAASEDYPFAVARDVDLYLSVARSLLNYENVAPELAPNSEVDALVAIIKSAETKQTITLFGRERSFDATQYTPRGHYAGDDQLERYFRTAMFLSRLEFNLVSRGTRSSQPGERPDPSETPHEATVALALADLAKRSNALADIAALDRAWTAFAGRREDIPFGKLAELRTGLDLKADDAPVQLRARIGASFPRSVNVFPNPNVAMLPAITTMIGPRITPDLPAFGEVVDGRGTKFDGAELGVMLGNDRALAYVKNKQPALAARATLAKARYGDDLYSAWLQAIRALATKPNGAVPSFMDKPAYADLRLDTTLAAYGQLKHNHVLIAAQVYDQGGCEIPDGYIEPALESYRALADYAARGKQVFAELDPKSQLGGGKYFTRLEQLVTVIINITREELANRPLSADAKHFLAMIVERREGRAMGYSGSFPVATYDGWYLDLFPSIDVGLKDAAFMADYFTYDRDGKQGIHYLGAKGPRLGVFVVDAGGGPRMMVGPVAHAFAYHGDLEHRLADEDAATVHGTEPWSASYTVGAAAPPDFVVEYTRNLVAPKVEIEDDEPRGETTAERRRLPPNVVRFVTDKPLGVVTIDILDHHFVTMKSIAVTVGSGRTDSALPRVPRPVEALRFHKGAFRDRLVLGLDGYGYAKFGAGAPEVESKASEADKEPDR